MDVTRFTHRLRPACFGKALHIAYGDLDRAGIEKLRYLGEMRIRQVRADSDATQAGRRILWW